MRAALIADIQRESEVSDELAAQLEELRAEVSSTRDDLLAATRRRASGRSTTSPSPSRPPPPCR